MKIRDAVDTNAAQVTLARITYLGGIYRTKPTETSSSRKGCGFRLPICFQACPKWSPFWIPLFSRLICHNRDNHKCQNCLETAQPTWNYSTVTKYIDETVQASNGSKISPRFQMSTMSTFGTVWNGNNQTVRVLEVPRV